mgnify:CR=1 FL=1
MSRLKGANLGSISWCKYPVGYDTSSTKPQSHTAPVDFTFTFTWGVFCEFLAYKYKCLGSISRVP